MATVSAPPRARRERPAPSPAPSIERHGTTRLYIEINRQLYKLRKVRPRPAGIVAAWGIVKIDHDRAEPVAYAVASDGVEIKCTCPDHSINGAECKHIRSLVAHGLVDRPGPAEPVAPAESPAPAPAESPADQFRGAVRAEVARLAPSAVDFDNRAIDRTAHILPEGWQPGGAPAPAPSPAPAKARKARRPKPLPCLECGRPIAAPSPDPAFCADCFAAIQEGGAQ